MNPDRAVRPPRWLFAACLLAIYVSALESMVPSDQPCRTVHSAATCGKGTACGADAAGTVCTGFLPALSATTLWLTLLMTLSAGLLWLSLSLRYTRPRFWLYVVIQGLSAAGIGILIRQPLVVLALYLTVLIAASPMVERIWEIVTTASLYALLLVGMTLDLSLPKWLMGPDVLHNIVQIVPLYGVTLLVPVGYAVIHLQLARAHEQLRGSAERIEELTLAAERQRLARELHDTLSQGLAGVVMQLNVALARLSGRRYEKAETAVQQAMANARSAMAEARRAIDDLRTVAVPPEAFVEAAREEIDRFGEATGIPCITDIKALVELSADYHDHCLRFIREALANVAQHAQARHVWIVAESADSEIALSVRDDGVGIDLTGSDATRTGHYGLVGLRERARLTGGRLDLTSEPGKGTTVRLRVPNRGMSAVEPQDRADAPRRSAAR